MFRPASPSSGPPSGPSSSARVASAAVRFLLFLTLWQVLVGDGPDAADMLFGAGAAVLASWMSLHLLPPCAGASLPGAARLALRLLKQTAAAGIQVAGMAFGPATRVRTGLVPHRSTLAPGTLRDAFTALTSLVPGTLPVGEDGEGRILYHCLDVQQPVGEQLRADELAVRRAYLARRDPLVPGSQIWADREHGPRSPRPGP